MAILNYITNNLEIIILIVFVISISTQLFYYYGIYYRFIFYRKTRPEIKKEPVSVIICARNEAENLDKNLSFFLEQDYPNYEVIVVNDCSDDDTAMVLGKFLKKYKHLKTTSITEDKKFKHGKKLAVMVGIKAAKNELLLFSDADCRPASNKWVEKIQQNFNDNTSIVLGYGGYIKQNGWLNNYIRYDTVWIALQYFSYSLFGLPYMGVGRNLAYRKSLFFKSKGFANHYHILSGDDDLFVNENATKENTAIEFSPESHTFSEPETTFQNWFKQKKRHLTTGKHYKKKDKFFLGLENVSRLLFYISFIWLIIIWYYPEFVLPLFAIRLLTYIWFTKKILYILKERNLLLSSLFFDVFSLCINFSLYITGRVRIKKQQWK